jgi:hypothetical protein
LAIVAVAEFVTAEEAHQAATLLHDSGIDAEVWQDPDVGLGGPGSARVVVAETEARRAHELLAAARRGDRDEDAVSEEDLARLALEAPEEDRETPAAPQDEEEDFVDVAEEQAQEDERYARITLIVAVFGIGVVLCLIATAFRLAFPPKGLTFSPRAQRWMRHARLAFVVSLAVHLAAIYVLYVRA